MEDDREKILAAVRKGLRGQQKGTAKRDSRSPLLSSMPTDFESLFPRFKSELMKVGGQAATSEGSDALIDFVESRLSAETHVFIYDEVRNLVEPILANPAHRPDVKYSSELNAGYDKRDVAVFDTVFMPCLACVAETGTVVFHSEARLPAALSTKLFVISEPHSLVRSLDEIFTEKFSNFVESNLFFITGPSRTADIEKELVTGVHGPKEVYVMFTQSQVRSVQENSKH